MDNDQSPPILLPGIIDIAREAGRAVMHVYESDDFEVETKPDDSPLTKADLAANEIIVRRLKELTPNIPIVSEEKLIDDELRLASKKIWLVDPIDGTKEFIKKNGQFTINIGLVDHGKPVLGVVYAPAIDRLYYGVHGEGAYKQRGEEDPVQITVSREKRPLIAVGSLSHRSPASAEWLEEHDVHETIAVGSSLKVCYVADGTADVYPRIDVHLSEWDIAAADAVLRAAGGTCKVFETGETVTYNKEKLRMPHFIISGKNFK